MFTQFPKCPFKSLVGLDCPGCGSQRAVHQILNGNWKEAFKANPLLVVAIPYLLVGIYFEMQKQLNKRMYIWRKRLYGTKAIYLVLGVILVFWVVRNL